MNMYLIINELNCCAIDADDYACNGYYIIRFSSSAYTLQVDLSIDGQVISSKKLIIFQLITILIIMFLQKINQITQLHI